VDRKLFTLGYGGAAGELPAEGFFARLNEIPKPFALLCAEHDHRVCHRRFLAELPATRGWTVEHVH
jgi:hypothetical protein